jgi:hypothetical protein
MQLNRTPRSALNLPNPAATSHASTKSENPRTQQPAPNPVRQQLTWTQTLRRARAARDQEEEGCSGRRGSLGIIIANARPGSRDGSGGAPGEGQQLASACRVVAAPAAAGGARAGFQVERAGVAPLPGLSPAGCRCRRRARCCCWLFARSLQAHAARAHQISCVPASLLTGRGAGDLRVGGG